MVGMIKLTDALTGGPCYVRTIDGIGSGVVFVDGAQKPCTWVYSNGAVLNVRETPDEIAKAASERLETDLLCDELLYGTPGDNAKHAKYGAPYPFEKRAVSVDLGSEKRTLINERHAVVWLLDRAGIDEGLTFVGRVDELAKTRKQAIDALTEIWLLVGGAGEPVKLKKLVDVVSARLREPSTDDDAHFPNANYKTLDGYEKMRAALDTIWNAINPRAGGPNGEIWTDPMEVNAAVRTACARSYVSDGVKTVRVGLMNDALDAIWFRIPVHTGRPDRAWHRDDPMEVLGAMIEMVVARDKETWNRGAKHAIHESDKRRHALDAIWTMIRGEGADWSDPDEVVNEVANLIGERPSVEPDGASGCTDCTTHTCLRDAGCAHGRQADDVPAATEREPVLHDITVDDAALAAAYEKNARPGCYTTDPVSATTCAGEVPRDSRCHGCAALAPHNGITVATDPTIPPDEVVMRSHTVDGKLLDEVRVVNVGFPLGKKCAGVVAHYHVGDDGREVIDKLVATGCTLADDQVEAIERNLRAAGFVVNVGTDPSGTDPFAGAADDEPAALSPRASVVITSLGTKARKVVRFLAGCDPQTSLRILGALFPDEADLGAGYGQAGTTLDGLVRLGLVVGVDRLPHDAGKPLMDRWTLTTLGREVARVLASKE